MKHYVIVPFYPYAKSPLHDEDLFTPGNERLTSAVSHLKRYLIPSLVNSSTHDFTVLLGINKDLATLAPDIHESLLGLKAQPCKVEVLDWFSYYDYITEQGDKEVIATRIDHDDCFGKDSLSLIQQRATFKEPFEFFAFMRGAMYWESTGVVKPYTSPTWKDGVSSFSASPTMYCRWDEIHALPVHGHTKLTSITDPLRVVLRPGVNHFLDYEHELSWLYVRHGMNRSREKWYHPDDTPIEVDLQNVFGLVNKK